MSSITPDGVRAELDQKAMRIGNFVSKSGGANSTSSSIPYIDSEAKLNSIAVQASKPLWVDASSVPHAGEFPFAVPLHGGVASTSTAILDIKGTSSNSDNEIYHLTLVDGTQVTTFTYKAFIRATITDSGGNIADGTYYIPLGIPS